MRLAELARAREVEVVEAVDQLLLRELVDVLLERKVDLRALVVDERLLHDVEDALLGHALAQPRLDLRVLEVEEVPGVVPANPSFLIVLQ